jgi:hypothetical protein
MKTHRHFLALGTALLALAGNALAQGPLTPPPGADTNIGPANALTPGGLPQATMKTLHQVEPRTPIPGGNSAITLNQSGSYYLTADVTVVDGPGVVIAASGIHLDLNGFRILSTNASPDFGDVGVGLGLYVKNISIRNGTISGGGAGGKFHSGIGPTAFSASSNVSVVDVTVSDTSHWGISLDTTQNSRVERCFVQTDGLTGAIQAALVADCSVTGGSVFAGIVRDSSATGGRIQGNVVKGSFASGGITTSVGENTGTAIPPSPAVPIAGPHFTISQPGSYYLTGNIEVASGNGINITSSEVTLDLRGFALICKAAAPAGGNAIEVATDLKNIAIKNGIIAGNTTLAISGNHPNQSWIADYAGFNRGIFAPGSNLGRNLSVNHIHVSGCRAAGIEAHHTSVTNSTATNNGGNGITAYYGNVTACTATNNGVDGIIVVHGNVTNCTAAYNGGRGIFASVGSVTNSTASLNGDDGIEASVGSVTNSTANYNGRDGIDAESGSVTNSTALNNGGDGIFASIGSVTNCVALSNNGLGGYFDLRATNAVIAFTKYGTGSIGGSTLTGNKTP